MSKKTILYVDDEEDIRLVVSACLEDAGYRVLTGANVAEGLKIAFSEFPDLIISDVMMPDESGYAFCTKLKADPSTKDIPVVFLTVMDDESTGMEVGATAFLCKPFEEEELLKTVGDVLQPGDSRALLDAALAHLRENRIDEATAKLQEILDTDGQSPLAVWARYYLGQVQQHRGQAQEAAESFAACLTQEPAFWRAHVRLGLMHEQGDPPRALKHFERALALNPNQADLQGRIEKLKSAY
jgi:CheY-like chemotaxis protein